MTEIDQKPKARMVIDAEVNMRGGVAPLVLDGEPFPYDIDKKHGVKVRVNDDNVHLVIVAIQVDRFVNVIDHATVEYYAERNTEQGAG